MAYTQAQLDALKRAIAAGVTEVDYNGRRVKYRSLAEMQRIAELMAEEISPSTATPRTSYAEFSRE